MSAGPCTEFETDRRPIYKSILIIKIVMQCSVTSGHIGVYGHDVQSDRLLGALQSGDGGSEQQSRRCKCQVTGIPRPPPLPRPIHSLYCVLLFFSMAQFSLICIRITLQTQRYHLKNVEEQTRDVRQLLKERHLTEQLVADQCTKLMHVVRQANVTVRWLFLHTLLVPTCASSRFSLRFTRLQ